MTRIPLSPIDHIFTGAGSYPIEFVFAYDGLIDVERLRKSFEATLAYFPPARSKLVRVDDGSYAFEAAEDGARLEVVESIDGFEDTTRRYSFLDPVESLEGEPLTRVQLTQTPKGSVLGVSMSHAVVDGFSYFYLLSTWARQFHGKRVLAPIHRRSLLLPEQTSDQKRHTPASILEESGIFWGDRRVTVDRDHMTWDRRVIAKPEMNALLREAQQQCAVRLSHNDVISALLWKEYSARWNSGDRDTPAYISCPVDFRRVLRSFPPNYFGCAVSLATTSLPRDDLAEASESELALEIRNAVARVNENYIWGALTALEELRKQEGLSVLEENHVIHPSAGLLVTNLSRLPVKEIAFDTGPPVAFDILTPAHRGAVVLPAEDGVDVRVCYIESGT
jgi:shikimate O-hydroxycinnamoyltransferase